MDGNRRWLMLALGTTAQTVACALVYGVPFLVPAIRRETGLSLVQAGALAAAPTVGLCLTLVLWGVLADRYGERLVLSAGVGLTALAGAGAALATEPLAMGVWLGLAGAMGASTSAASGRLVIGWFDASQRGLAMGIRQVSTVLGMALAALVLPPLAQRFGPGPALLAPAAACAATAVVLWLLAQDPPEPAASPQGADPVGTASPYRTATLWRVHAASALLVIPQFATGTFAAEYLVGERGWGDTAAGRVLAVIAVVGAGGRILAGVWSDQVRSRLRPMRQIAVLAGLTMLGLGLAVATDSVWAVPALAMGLVVSVTDNGLAFTAVAELAGRGWSGRALGVQNTGQNVVAFATAPAFGALAGARGFGAAFALCALAPAVATLVTPVRAERAALARSGR